MHWGSCICQPVQAGQLIDTELCVLGKMLCCNNRAGLTLTATGLPFITGIFTSALLPLHFPKQNLTMMPTCAAPHAPAVQSIMKCTPNSLAVLLALVLPGLDLPMYSRKVVQRAYDGRQRGACRGGGVRLQKREGIHHDSWLTVVTSANFPGHQCLLKIALGKDYSKLAGKVKLWAQEMF